MFYHDSKKWPDFKYLVVYSDFMLKQASIRQIQQGEINKNSGYLVATMCFYPRGLKKELLDEYRVDLAPDRDLFKDFKHFQALVGHEDAFKQSLYEERFYLTRRALEALKSLVDLSRKQDVFFACQCEVGQRCHREILLLIAEKEFGAQIDSLHNSYETFQKRLPEVMNVFIKSI